MSGSKDQFRPADAETLAYLHAASPDDLAAIGTELAKDPVVLWRLFALCPLLTAAAAHFSQSYIEVERAFEKLDLKQIAHLLDSPDGHEVLVTAIGRIGGWSNPDPFLVQEH